VEFGILGPLEVLRGGDPVPLPGAKQRALVAALVLHVGEVVTADVLADVLWGEEQPANPRNALQSQVSQLRRALGSDGKGIVVSRPTGYALDVAADAVDAVRFEAGSGRGVKRSRPATSIGQRRCCVRPSRCGVVQRSSSSLVSPSPRLRCRGWRSCG
jgi:DNA-binding SARP family transcriptional activator